MTLKVAKELNMKAGNNKVKRALLSVTAVTLTILMVACSAPKAVEGARATNLEDFLNLYYDLPRENVPVMQFDSELILNEDLELETNYYAIEDFKVENIEALKPYISENYMESFEEKYFYRIVVDSLMNEILMTSKLESVAIESETEGGLQYTAKLACAIDGAEQSVTISGSATFDDEDKITSFKPKDKEMISIISEAVQAKELDSATD